MPLEQPPQHSLPAAVESLLEEGVSRALRAYREKQGQTWAPPQPQPW